MAKPASQLARASSDGNWTELNAWLRAETSTTKLQGALDAELSRVKPRMQFVLRIHSRLGVVKRELERVALRAAVRKKLSTSKPKKT